MKENSLITRLKGLQLPAALAAFSLLLTGCPHNVYEVLVQPRGNVVERTLTFYREEGEEDDGTPKYRDFGTDDLAAIAALYPAGGTSAAGDRHTAKGRFTNEMPGDVGGAGVYSNLITSLGETGFYVEHFRGNEDLAGMVEKRNHAADRVADMLIGWSRAELGQEAGYDKLHKFLDNDFRHDLKNLGQYMLRSQTAGVTTNVDGELLVRLGEYMVGRGYFQLGEMAQVFQEYSASDSEGLSRRVQRIVARKMGLPESAPIPASLAFSADDATRTKSFEKYLAGTDAYKALLKQWETDKVKTPDLKQPPPAKVLDDVMEELIQFDFGSTPDSLTVRLSLPLAAVYSNGKWDAAKHQVAWESSLPAPGVDAAHLPVLCYATWAQADEAFQKAHIGTVAITNEDLMQYCVWRGALDPKRGAEWDNFLSNLKPGGAWWRTVDAFRFSGEPLTVGTNAQGKIPLASDYPRQLLQKAIE